MLKRTLRTALTLLLIASLLTASASASSVSGSPTSRYTHINAVMAGLGIENGIATAKGAVEAWYLETRVVVRLQRYDQGDGWVTIKVWHASDDSHGFVATGGTHALDRTGYSYRTQVIATVYNADGDLLESEIMYSDLRYY